MQQLVLLIMIHKITCESHDNSDVQLETFCKWKCCHFAYSSKIRNALHAGTVERMALQIKARFKYFNVETASYTIEWGCQKLGLWTVLGITALQLNCKAVLLYYF